MPLLQERSFSSLTGIIDGGKFPHGLRFWTGKETSPDFTCLDSFTDSLDVAALHPTYPKHCSRDSLDDGSIFDSGQIYRW